MRLVLSALLLVGCTAEQPIPPHPVVVEVPDMGEAPDLAPPPPAYPGETRLDGPGAVPLTLTTHEAVWRTAAGDVVAAFVDANTGGGAVHLFTNPTMTVGAGDSILAWWVARSPTTATGVDVGPLSVWSEYGTPAAISDHAALGIGAVARGANDWVAFVDNVSAAGDSGDVYLARADGSAATRLLSGVSLSVTCRPALAFFYAQTLAVSHCNAGTGAATLTLFDVQSTVAHDVATPPLLPGFVRSSDASTLFVLDTSDTLYMVVASSSSSTAQLVDKDVHELQLTADGSRLSYLTGTTLRLRDTFNAANTRDVPNISPVAQLLSPDGQRAVYWNTNADTHDLSLVMPGATSAIDLAGALGPVRLAPIGRGLGGSFVFTDDSAFVFFFTGVDATTEVGTLQVATSNAVMTTHAQATQAIRAWPARGSRLLYADHTVAGVSDLHLVDLGASGAPPVLVTAGVDPATVVTDAARTRILYTHPALNAGLYTRALP